MPPDDIAISERVRDQMHLFTPRERKAAHVLLANYPIAGLETVAEFAARAAISAPTVLRFVGRLGFAGYPDFQRALREELDQQGQSPLSKMRFGEGPDGVGGPYERFRNALVENVAETFLHLPTAEFDAIVALLADLRVRVHTIGGRFTDPLARHLATHLTVIRPGVSHLDGQAANWRDQLVDMRMKDVLVIFDIRRYQEDLIWLADAASTRGVTVTLVTDQWLSPIARHAKHIIAARIQVPSRWDSMTAMLGLVEALLAAVTECTWEQTKIRIAEIDRLKRRGKP